MYDVELFLEKRTSVERAKNVIKLGVKKTWEWAVYFVVLPVTFMINFRNNIGF